MPRGRKIMDPLPDEDKLYDHRFMSKADKQKVLKQWKTFFQGGFQRKHFTKGLYKHLINHCSFIAYYDIHGFYDHFFDCGPTQLLREFKAQFGEPLHLSAEGGNDSWLYGDTAGDLCRAMCRAFEPYYANLSTGSLGSTSVTAPTRPAGRDSSSSPKPGTLQYSLFD